MKNKIINNLLTYGFIVFLIALLIDSIIKKNILVSIVIILEIIIFLPIIRKIILKLIGKDKDGIIYIPRVLITILLIILIPLTSELSFYHKYISEDKKTTIIIEKYKIKIKKNGKENIYKYSFHTYKNTEYYIEVEKEIMYEQFMLLKYDEKDKLLCTVVDGKCTEFFYIND